MEAYNYRHVDEQLIHELHDALLTAKSVVLLGPRYGGKRHAMDRLPPLLRASGIEPIVRLRLRSDTPICTTVDMGKLIRQAVIESDDNGEYPVSEDPFEPLKKLVLRKKKPAILLAANVDGMSHHLARRFIQEIRTLVEARELVVIMSAESDFRELVHGENSDFSCAEHYVVQGYGLDEFSSFLTTELKYLRIKFAEPEQAYQNLWVTTGSSLYILRVLLWTIIQERARSKNSARTPISSKEIPSELTLTRIPGAYGAHIFQHAAQLIARDVSCWKDLQELMKGNSVTVQPHDAPTRLELAGIATRRISEGDAELQFSSPVMKAFVDSFYDDRRFGDLYASVGEWDTAFERYNGLEAEERLRPSSTDDRSELEATLGLLCSSFYKRVAIESKDETKTNPIEGVKKFFAEGCRYLMGFQEITFWQRDTHFSSPEWQYDSLDSTRPTQDVLEQIRKLLPAGSDENPPGPILKLDERGRKNKYAVAAVLPTALNKEGVVVVSDFENGVVLSQEREALIGRLLTHFIGAYEHAVDVEHLQMRNRIQRHHEQIISSIYDSLDKPKFDVPKLLQKAARGLRELGYRRVLFCLVDYDNYAIVGVVDDSDDPSVDVAAGTNWSLDLATEDLQPYVISTGFPKIVADATKEPLANPKLVCKAGMRALAIVPILNRAKKAIGTIHVERLDRSVPQPDEVEGLKLFGNNLAIAIEQCARLNLMEAVLDKIPEPLMIFDKHKQPQYKNQAASRFFGGQTGWHNPQDGRSNSNDSFRIDKLPANISNPIFESLDTGNRRDTYIEGLQDDPKYLGQVISDVIQDWRDHTVGGLLRIQDRTNLHRYFEAQQTAAEAPDAPNAIQRILEATTLLGHKWGRLYLVRKTGDGRSEEFVSCLSYGSDLPSSVEESFNDGKIVLTAPRSEKGHYDWLCVNRKKPIVFCWNDDLPNGDEIVTNQGINVVNWIDPQQHPDIKKKPGDFWMDFPLMDGSKVLGKVCLELDENLRQEDFSLLSRLSDRFAAILAAKFKQEQDFNAREQWIRKSVAERTFETFMHNLVTRLSSLYVIYERYMDKGEGLEEIMTLNKEFEGIIDYVDSTTTRASGLLGGMSTLQLKREKVDIGKVILQTLQSNLHSDAWTMECAGNLPSVLIDVERIRTTLLEFIRNSNDAAASPEQMKIDIKIGPYEGAGAMAPGVEIQYRDNGPGIPAEYSSQIFDDFFSFHPNDDIPGTGLGMGFAKRVVEAHGGSIVYSSPFSGYTNGVEFRIYLPGPDDSGLMEGES